ncbi:hypothetical protein LX36DRAFT_650202 [Colletotrichum falcatum]|nr:hypothetical protein LX36DRAFT_650202 [Colletotrichum falcatum]
MSQNGVHAKPFYGAMMKKRLGTAATALHSFFPTAIAILGWPYASYRAFDGRI